MSREAIELADRLADARVPCPPQLLSDLLYDGMVDVDGWWNLRTPNIRWYLALAAFNALQSDEQFRAGERWPELDEPLQGEDNSLLTLRFALEMTRKEVSPGADVFFDRPDLAVPDLTRVAVHAARTVAYDRQPDDRPDVRLMMLMFDTPERRQVRAWDARLEENQRIESGHQASIVREVFGNPFRPVIPNPAWLTPTVLRMAEAIDLDRTFDRLPILADALQEAGCEDTDILDHCRGGGPYVRGCWVIEVILGER